MAYPLCNENDMHNLSPLQVCRYHQRLKKLPKRKGHLNFTMTCILIPTQMMKEKSRVCFISVYLQHIAKEGSQLYLKNIKNNVPAAEKYGNKKGVNFAGFMIVIF